MSTTADHTPSQTRIISDWSWVEYKPEPFVDEIDLTLLPTHAWHKVTEKLVKGEWVRVTHWHFGGESPDRLDDPRPNWAWDSPELFLVDNDEPILRLVDDDGHAGLDPTHEQEDWS